MGRAARHPVATAWWRAARGVQGILGTLALAASAGSWAQPAGGASPTAPGPPVPTTPATPSAPAVPSVALGGSMGGGRALLLIDGQPQVLAVGASARGVTLLRLGDGEAQVLVAGQSLRLQLGGTPVRLAGSAARAAAAASAATAATTIVLPMGPGGHFMGAGAINGRPVQFLVDTGATTVALSQAEANRIGLDWKRGRALTTHTANGSVPVHAVVLDSVRLGGVELANVAAVVVPADMPAVLLGNSFLNRFSMQRQADVMRLDKRP